MYKLKNTVTGTIISSGLFEFNFSSIQEAKSFLMNHVVNNSNYIIVKG